MPRVNYIGAIRNSKNAMRMLEQKNNNQIIQTKKLEQAHMGGISKTLEGPQNVLNFVSRNTRKTNCKTIINDVSLSWITKDYELSHRVMANH